MTRDEERFNLDKFLGKVKYLLKLLFARQMLWPFPARDIERIIVTEVEIVV